MPCGQCICINYGDKHEIFCQLFVCADGFVIIECEEPGTGHATGQVILDYLTDTVVNKKASVRGSPLVSPDSRIIVSIDRAPDGVTLVVQQVLGEL